MGYETPNIDRIAKEGTPVPALLRRAIVHGGPRGVSHRPARYPHRSYQSRFPGRAHGHEPARSFHRRPAKEPWLRHRPVRQEPCRRSQRDLADGQRLRRVLRQLYHLNAEEEPELPDYPKDAAFKAQWGPRGVLDCKASDTDDATQDPRFGKIGKQTIKDTGPLTKKRMETIDDETSDRAIDYMTRQSKASQPFFCWFNSTRMHLRTHVRPEHRGKYTHGDSEYIDGMIEHDQTIGKILKAMDDLGIADNTLVVYTTDNGPHMNTWPDGAMTPFRSEKNTNWEGAFRVPCLVRWPGKIKPGTITNELMSHNDWIPTLCAIAGEPDIVGKCKAGYNDKRGHTYNVHLDGYDQSKFLTSVEGTVGKNNGVKSARNSFYYTDDDGLLVALRLGDYKASFAEQRIPGTMAVWGEPFTVLRLTKLYNLMQDPYERADITSNTYWDWIINHVPQVYQGMGGVMTFLASFDEFPPRSTPPSFNPANMLEQKLYEIKAKQKIERAFPMLRAESEKAKEKQSK